MDAAISAENGEPPPRSLWINSFRGPNTRIMASMFLRHRDLPEALDIPAGQVGKELYLDLGVVKELAEVVLNGHNLGALRKAPFRVNITKFGKARRERSRNPRDQPLAEPPDRRRSKNRLYQVERRFAGGMAGLAG